jgi:archaemetzincin
MFDQRMLKRLFVISLIISGCSSNDRIAIGIQPWGGVEKNLIDSVSRALSTAYGAEVVVLPVEAIPVHAFVNIKSPRYRADKLIDYLRHVKPDSLDHILAITNADISTTKKDWLGNTLEPKSKYEDWGVFGLGYMPGASCIVSTFRTHGTTAKNFTLRMKKISLHEIGHNMGLDHCISDRCVMRDAAESISTVDNVDVRLCEEPPRNWPAIEQKSQSITELAYS